MADRLANKRVLEQRCLVGVEVEAQVIVNEIRDSPRVEGWIILGREILIHRRLHEVELPCLQGSKLRILVLDKDPIQFLNAWRYILPIRHDGITAGVPIVPVRIKSDEEISPTLLRSPDDPEATYRKKAGKVYEGYVINVTETCDPSNDFQLILKMQSAPNVTEDTTLLKEVLPELNDSTEVDTFYNYAGFCGPKVDEVLNKLEITQVPSALRGRAPNPEHTTLADCDIELDADGNPIRLTCPHGYTAHVIPGRKEGRFIARWDEDACPECHFSSHHTGRKPNAKTCLRFSQTDLVRALRRQLMRAYRQGNRHLRAAVEATVGALKRPFNNDKVPVRGLIRLSQVMVGSAVMVNIRRIQRHLAEKRKEKYLLSPGQAHISSVQPSLLSSLSIWLQRRLQVIHISRMMPVFGF